MGRTYSDYLEQKIEEAEFTGDSWKNGVGPRKANYGHSTMGQGGSIHFDHRGNELPTYRHTPRLLGLLNASQKPGETTLAQRHVDEYRRARDAGLETPLTNYVKKSINEVVPGNLADAQIHSGGYAYGLGKNNGTYTGASYMDIAYPKSY